MAYTNEQLGKALEDLTIAYNNFIEKAKEAAIAAMKDTVVAQIKQDAKEYIAAELATQKDALIQAIEHAKIALRNSAIEADNKLKQTLIEKKNELQALITIAENTLKEKTDEAAQNINTAVLNAEENLNTATKKIIKQAKRDLDGHGNAILATLKGEMTSLLAGIEARLMARIDLMKDTLTRIYRMADQAKINTYRLLNIARPDGIFFFFTLEKRDEYPHALLEITIKSLYRMDIKNHKGETMPFVYSGDSEVRFKVYKSDITTQRAYDRQIEYLILYGIGICGVDIRTQNYVDKVDVYMNDFSSLMSVEKDNRVELHILNCPNYHS